MAMSSGYRLASVAVALTLQLALTYAPARAALNMAVGARAVVANAPVSDCSAKARNALNTVLQNAFEAGDGTNQWLAYGPLDATGHSSATAAIHCYPADTGYIASFACAVEVPPSPDTAANLCTKLVAAFGAGKTAALTPPAGESGGAP